MFFRLFRPACLWLLFFVLAGQPFARAQEPKPTDPPQTKPDDSQPTIYVPYTKLREVFEKEGRGVFLPYGEFRKLWDAAHAKPTPVEPAAPYDALISEIESDAAIEQDVVRVDATLTIELLKKGWLQIPLRLSDVALQKATIDNQPARVIAATSGGYQLLIEHADAQPQTLKLNLQYAKAYVKSPGQNHVEIDAPAAPVNRWRIHIAQPGVKINVQPYIAATDATERTSNAATSKDNSPDAEASPEPSSDKESVLLALVGAAPRVVLDWTPKSEGASGMTALATTQVTQELFVSETSLRTRADVRYDISRSTLSKLTIDVPADQKIINVFDANVRKWQVEAAENKQRVSIELFEPATSQQSIVLELEKIIEQASLSSLAVPTIATIDVGRQQGTLVIKVDPTLRAEVSARTGLIQLDMAELPAHLVQQPWTFAYRYAALPYDLTLSLVKIQPRITVQQWVQTYVLPDVMTVDTYAKFNIAEAGVFQLEFDIPAGFTVREVTGVQLDGTNPASVDSHHIDANKPNHLIINLNKKALGPVSLLLKLEQKQTDPNLQAPTGTAASLVLAVPKANQEFVTRVTGQLILSAPESLRLNPQATDGLRPVSLGQAMATNPPPTSDPRTVTARPTLAFAFAEQPASGTLSVERRKPFITARQHLLVKVEAGVVRYEARFFFDILYSGVNSLRIDVPTALASEIQNETSNIREAAINPPPADVAADYVAWSFTGQSELVGQQVIALSWEQKLEELAVGKSVEVSVPYLKPRNLDRAWGQIVVTKSEALDVQPGSQPTGVRAIDPHHDVMRDVVTPNASRAFEFHDDWSLKLNVTRYKLEEVKQTSIERALVRAVRTRSGQLGIQALYRLRSAHQRLTLQLPADIQFDAQPVRVNGNPVSLERGDKDELYIPLAGFQPDQSLILELRYSLDNPPGRLDIPFFPDDPAVQRVFLNVFLPKEQAIVGWTGPWTQQWQWQNTDWFAWSPIHQQTDEQIEAWVKEGVSVAASPPFQRDGTLYSFSTLKPQPAPAGSLRLVLVSSQMLTGGALLVLAMFAFGLLRSSLRLKVLAVVAILLALVLVGVFATSLAGQLMSLPIVVSMLVVVLVWVGWYVYLSAERRDRLGNTPPSATLSANASSVEIVPAKELKTQVIPPEPDSSTSTGSDTPKEGGERHE